MSYIVASSSSRWRFVLAASAVAVSIVFSALEARAQTVTLTSTSGDTIYWDHKNTADLMTQYVAIKVESTSGVADAWVQLTNIAGNPDFSLATGEDGKYHIGALSANTPAYAFFLLKKINNQTKVDDGTVDLKLWNGVPDVGSQVGATTTLTVKVNDSRTIQANANKVTGGSVSASPIVGGLVTVVVTGKTGTIGAAEILTFSPAAKSTWNPAAFELQSTKIVLSYPNAGTYLNTLQIPTSSIVSSANTSYTATYVFRAVNTTSTATSVSPTAHISSGTQVKHTAVDSFSAVPSIAVVSNPLRLTLTGIPALLEGSGVKPATWSVKLINTGARDATLDELRVTLPTTPGTPTYTASSSTYNGSSISDPSLSGSVLIWSQLFTVPANSTRELKFVTSIPATNGSYQASAVGKVGETQIDTTLSTSDSSPATAIIYRGPGTPDLMPTLSHSGTFSLGQNNATYTLSIANNGTGATTGTQVTATFSVGSTAGLSGVSASGSGWTCGSFSGSPSSISCTRSDVLVETTGSNTYPDITITTDVASNSNTPVVPEATVSGGGENVAVTGNNSTIDPTSITSPDMSLQITHAGDFTRNQTGAQYSVFASNVGNGVSTGQVTVVLTIPAGLSATAASGTGWSCPTVTATSVSCNRSDELAANGTYDAITLTVNVTAASATTVNLSGTVSGGGETNTANNSAIDATNIVNEADLIVSLTGPAGPLARPSTGNSYSATVANNGTATTPTGQDIIARINFPTGLTPTNPTGVSGWTCTTSSLTVECTRTTALSGGTSATAIPISVAVDNAASSPLTTEAEVELAATDTQTGETTTTNNTASHTVAVTVPTYSISGTVRDGSSNPIESVTITASDGHSGSATTDAAGAYTISSVNEGATAIVLTPSKTGYTFSPTTRTVNNVTASVTGQDFTGTVTVVAPSATTVAASNVTSTSATLNGTINANGDSTTVTFVYGTNSLLTTGTTTVTATGSPVTGTSNTSVTYALSGLTAGTTYYFKAKGVNSAGMTEGSILSFVARSAPTATTVAASTITSTSATLNGTINPRGADTTVTFIYGTASDLSTGTEVSASPSTIADTGGNSGVTYAVSGLTPGTTYYFRVKGVNAVGTTLGTIESFVAKAAPSATTNAATSVTSTSATLNGSVNPRGAATTVKLRYGTDAELDAGLETLTNASPATVAATGTDTAVSLAISSLTPGTTYYFRVEATNADGTTTGSILSFVAKAAPSATTNAATSVTSTSATLNGSVNPRGAATTVKLRYGTDAELDAGTETLTNASPATVAATGTDTAVSLAISSLTPGTTYYFRVEATNADGTTTGSILNFVAREGPLATTSAATNLAATGVTLNGSVNAQGASTTVTFVYSTASDLSADPQTVAVADPVTGAIATAVSKAITGLAADTTYYYRVVAQNIVATTNGSILSFTTAGVDLRVTMTHTGNFTQGQTTGAAYTVRVSNAGLAASNGAVTAAVTIPTGLTPTTATGDGWGCTISGANVNCTRSDTLAGNSSFPDVTIVVSVSSTAAASVSGSTTVSGGADRDTTNNTATDATTINGAPDIRVALTHTGNFTQGQTTGATYKLVVSNAGRGASTGLVTATVTIPTGLTPTTAAGDGWACGVDGATVTCTRSDVLAGGASYPDANITVTVSSTAPASVNSTATVSGGGDSDTTNNTVTDATNIDGAPDVRVTMTHVGNFAQGQTTGATYKVSVSNAGRGATTGAVTATATIPTGLTATAAGGEGWTCTIEGATVTCTRGDVLAGGASYPDVVITVSVSTTAGSSLTPSVSVSGGGDTNTSNNTATDATAIDGAADLRIAISHTGAFTLGQSGATYTVTVSNAGRGTSSGTVTAVVTMPTGLTPADGTGTGWTCSVSGANISCTRTDAVAGAASYPAITATASVSPTAAASVTTTATVSGGGDVDATNNTASDPTSIGGGPDLRVKVSHSGDFTKGQANASYTIAVSNTGNGPTTGPVSVSVTLPEGLTLTSATGSGWTCAAEGQVVTCTRSDVLDASSDYPLVTILVSVSTSSASSVTTAATVAGGGDIDTSNNSSTDATTITNGTDLRIAITHSGDFTQGQSGAAYRVTVSNAGDPSSGEVIVVATLPTGLIPTGGSGTGWSCSASGATLTCRRSDAVATSSSYPTLTLNVDVARTATTPLAVTATVSGGADRDSSNNTASDEATVVEYIARADIGLKLTATPATVRLDETTNAVLTVTNHGPDETADVVIGWFLPPGLEPGGATTSQGSYNPASTEWYVGTLASGASATMTLPGTLTLAGSPTIMATRISSRAIDPSNANDSAAAMLNTDRVADVGVSLEVSDTYPLVGNTALIKVRAFELSGETVKDVVISTGLPAGVTLTSHTASSGTFDAASGRWTIATMPGGSSETLEFSVKVDAAGVLASSARVVRMNLTDGNALNDYTTTVMNGVSSTSLYLTKTASRRTLSVGDKVAITTIVTNDGPATVQMLVVSDALPSSLKFVSSTTKAGTYDAITGLWSVGAVAPGERRALTLIATVLRDGSITSTARLHSGFGSDPLEDDNSASVTLSAQPVADIEVTVESPERALIGRSARYVVRVRNLGPSNATGVTVTAGIPFGMSLTSATPSTGTYAAGSGEWVIGAMENGALESLVFSAVVQSTAVVVRAAKTKGDQFDPAIGNNQAAAIPAGANWADVQVNISLDAEEPKVGEPLLTTVRVKNVGPAAATGISIKAPVPSGFALTSAEPTAGRFDVTSGIWAIDALAVDAEVIMQMNGTVTTTGAIVFVADKKASAPYDPMTANDQDGAAANAEIADLQVVTTVDKTEPLEGERVAITVVVTNNTRAAASNVSIASSLPVGMRYVKHRTTSGTYDPTTGKWTITSIPQVGPTGNVTLEITAVVASRVPIDASAALGSLDQIDLVSANNTSTQTVSGSGWSTFQTDLVLESRVEPALVMPGAVATYTVSSTNLGPTYTADLTISGATPDQTTLVSIAPSAGGECTAPALGARGTFTCTWGDVTRLQTRTVTLAVRVPADARQGSTLIARFATESPIGELYPPNNKATTAVSVAEPAATDLAVTATATAGGSTGSALTLPVGTQAVVQFAVRNISTVPLAAAKYVIEGVDTTQLSLRTFTASDGAVSGTGNEGEWVIGALAPGQAATLQVTVGVAGMRSSAVSIMRMDSSPGDANAFNDTATVVLDGVGDPRWAGRRLAAGNVDGVPGDELIISGGEAETPFVSVLRPEKQFARFTAYDRRFVGGAHLATCDIDGDGRHEVIVGSGPHGGPHVRVMKVGATQAEEQVGFYAFEADDDKGISVACTDVDGDGRPEVLVSRMAGASEIAVFSIGRRTAARLMTIRPYESSFTGGVRIFALPPDVATATGADFDFLTATGPGRDFEIVAWRVVGGTATRVKTITPSPGYSLGGFVNAADLDRDGKLDLVMTTDSPSEAIIGVLSYTTGQLTAMFRPYEGMSVAGVHLAIARPDVAGEPWIFITPARGPTPGIDIFKLSGGALQRVARVPVVEVP